MIAKILGVLLVATAAAASDPLSEAQKSFHAAAASAMATAAESHMSAKVYVDGILWKIQSTISPQSKVSSSNGYNLYLRAFSKKCYEFLKERLDTSRPMVVECSQTHLRLITIQRDRIEKFNKHVLSRIERARLLADSCVSWSDSAVDTSLEPAGCIKVMEQDMKSMIDQVDSMFSEMASTAAKLANDWVSDTGYCVSSNETPNRIKEWFWACKL